MMVGANLFADSTPLSANEFTFEISHHLDFTEIPRPTAFSRINETGDKTMGLAAILRQEGRQEGESALLLRLMALRFGPLANSLRERVQAEDVVRE
jgi:hypothetical protein